MSKPKTPGEMTDAELDAAIALELFDGDKPVFAPADLAGNPFPVPTRRFSTDPALTLPLIEKARERGIDVEMRTTTWDRGSCWDVWVRGGGKKTCADVSLVPRAVYECILAALRDTAGK